MLHKQTNRQKGVVTFTLFENTIRVKAVAATLGDPEVILREIE